MLCTVSATTRGATRAVLLGSCATVGAAGVLYGMNASQQKDEVRISPAP
jgi:hypothetical protein